VLQHNFIYENPHDPDKQHCSTCLVDMKNKQQNWQLVSLFYTFFM